MEAPLVGSNVTKTGTARCCPHDEQVVTAGSSHLQRPLGMLLPAYVDQVRRVLVGRAEGGRRLGPRHDGLATAQVLDELGKRCRAEIGRASCRERV